MISGRVTETIKSPSDTTIYALALKQKLHKVGVNEGQIGMEFDTPMESDNNAKFINDISTFIESVRLGVRNKESEDMSTPRKQEVEPKPSSEVDQRFEEARDKVAQIILDVTN